MTSLQRALASGRNGALKRDDGRQRRDVEREQERPGGRAEDSGCNYPVMGDWSDAGRKHKRCCILMAATALQSGALKSGYPLAIRSRFPPAHAANDWTSSPKKKGFIP